MYVIFMGKKLLKTLSVKTKQQAIYTIFGHTVLFEN